MMWFLQVRLGTLIGAAAGFIATSCPESGLRLEGNVAGEQREVELANSADGRAVAEYDADNRMWLEGDLRVYGTEDASVRVRRFGTNRPAEELWSRTFCHIPWVAVRGDGESVLVSYETDPRGTGVRMQHRVDGAAADAPEPFMSSDLIIERIGRDGTTLDSKRLVRSGSVTGGGRANAVPFPALVEYGARGERVFLWLDMGSFTRVLELDPVNLQPLAAERVIRTYDNRSSSRDEARIGRPIASEEHVFVLLAEPDDRRWHLAVMSVDGKLISRVDDLQHLIHTPNSVLPAMTIRRSGRGAAVVGADGSPLLGVLWENEGLRIKLRPDTF